MIQIKTVELKIYIEDWYAHAKSGGMRWTYYGGKFDLSYKDNHKSSKYIDPHTKQYAGEESFIMDMIIKAISLLNQPCIIKLDIPEESFPYDIIKKGIYEYWKRNNWCYKNGGKVSEEWIEFDRLISDKGHIVKVDN